MANLSITLQCNRDCPYCFARDVRRDDQALAVPMSRETFLNALGLLERSGIDQVRLLGGEPTLHPDLEWLVNQSLDRGFRLLVFSNGLMTESALKLFEGISPERASVLINVNAIEEQSPAESAQQAVAFARLGPRVTAGLNIHNAAPKLGFLLDLVTRHGLNRRIRLGLAHPCLNGANQYLHPKHYRPVGERIAEFASRAMSDGIGIDFDCGFVPCMFPEGFLEACEIDPRTVGLRCGAVPDILPDGSAAPCYPMASRYKAPLDDSSDASQMRDLLDEQMRPNRALGIYRECARCDRRESAECLGGCLSAAMLRLRSGSFVAAVPRQASAEPPKADKPNSEKKSLRWVVPYIDRPLSFWEQLHEEFGESIQEVYFPLPSDLIGSGRPAQPAEHLDEFLRASPLPRSVLVNPITLPLPVAEIGPLVVESLRRLHGESEVSGATVSNLQLAEYIRERLPDLPLTASVLMDISRPNQALMLEGICETLVPASRTVRDLPALEALRDAFRGRIRLIVNEGCLPGCPFRVQHFHEMGSGFSDPHSLCDDLLAREPWMRLTGSWVLPQHLHLYDGLYDELKLAGRVTLRDPARYRSVLAAYIRRTPLPPNAIGGGPASVLAPLEITEAFFASTLRCGQRCHTCTACRDYYENAQVTLSKRRLDE